MGTASFVPTLLLLHEGGWDEVLMVAIGLGLAYLVIMWTGRRARDDEDAEDETADEALAEGTTDEQSREQTRS